MFRDPQRDGRKASTTRFHGVTSRKSKRKAIFPRAVAHLLPLASAEARLEGSERESVCLGNERKRHV